MSTDSAGSMEKMLQENFCFPVSHDVRVRRESFGLLFYNTRNAKLTFVNSGNLLRIGTLPQGRKTITAVRKSAARMKVKKLLDDLLRKGLIFEA